MEKLYDLLNSFKEGNKDNEVKLTLENELGDMEAFEKLEERIMNDISDNDEPSNSVKNKLDAAFNQKFKSDEPHQMGIIPITKLNSKKPWKVFAYAASISLFMYFTVQVGFQDMGSMNTSYPLLADSIGEVSIDSNQFSVETVVFPN